MIKQFDFVFQKYPSILIVKLTEMQTESETDC